MAIEAVEGALEPIAGIVDKLLPPCHRMGTPRWWDCASGTSLPFGGVCAQRHASDSRGSSAVFGGRHWTQGHRGDLMAGRDPTTTFLVSRGRRWECLKTKKAEDNL